MKLLLRFVVVLDPHIRGNRPINRKDDLQETLQRKVKEVIEIAKEFRADAFLCAGDLFEVPIPSLEIAGEIMSLFLSAGIPFYIVPGNHDFYAANPITLPRTLLGYTNALGALTIVDENSPQIVKKDGIKVKITGQSYHSEIDRRDPKLDYCVEKTEGYRTIHLVHGMLSDGGFIPGDVTQIDDILETEADITIAGHNHLGWGIIEREGKYFINPGGLLRLSNHPAEMARKVGVALIEIDMDNIKCEIRELKSALPAEDVLDRTKVEEAAVLESKLEEFSKALQETTELNSTDVEEIIRQAVIDSDESSDVLIESLRRLAIAKEGMAKKGAMAA